MKREDPSREEAILGGVTRPCNRRFAKPAARLEGLRCLQDVLSKGYLSSKAMHFRFRTGLIAIVLLSILICGCLQAQEAAPVANDRLTLDQVIRRAQANEPAFAAAAAEGHATELERKDARAGLLPTVAYHNQYVFTQSNHTSAATTQGGLNQSLPVFIANNAVHEYYSQGVVNETVGLAQVGAVRLADANAARAQAELEIARRGLVLVVVSLYYNLHAGIDRVAIAQRALDEASHFLDL
jgi:Outer membrane efflux protein